MATGPFSEQPLPHTRATAHGRGGGGDRQKSAQSYTDGQGQAPWRRRLSTCHLSLHCTGKEAPPAYPTERGLIPDPTLPTLPSAVSPVHHLCPATRLLSRQAGPLLPSAAYSGHCAGALAALYQAVPEISLLQPRVEQRVALPSTRVLCFPGHLCSTCCFTLPLPILCFI